MVTDMFHIFFLFKNNLKKDTPQSELLLRTMLNQNTSASGHSGRPQNIESTNIVSPTNPTPAGIVIFINL